MGKGKGEGREGEGTGDEGGVKGEGRGPKVGEEGWARGVRFPADDVNVGDGVFAQLIEGIVVVRNSGDAGLAGGLEGQEPGVISAGEVASGF